MKGFYNPLSIFGLTLICVFLSLFILKLSHRKPVIVERKTAIITAASTSPHAAFGMPSLGSIGQPGYVTKLNGRTRCPDWVLWKVEAAGEIDRKHFPFTPDKNVPPEFRQSNDDYRGAMIGNTRIDRGHQKPAKDSSQTAETMAASMLLDDNLCPQSAILNEHTWLHLEDHVRELAAARPTWCATGPLWIAADGSKTFTVATIGDDAIWVPTHFYKLALCLNVEYDAATFNPATLEEGDVELFAWSLPNTDAPPADFNAGIVTTDQVERWAGVDHWPLLPDTFEETLERK